MTEPDFLMPPEGMVSDQIDLIDFRMVLGIVHPESYATPVIAAWNGEQMRHVEPAKAQAWAEEIETGPLAATFAPVSGALRKLCGRIGETTAAMTVAAEQRRTSHYRAISERSAKTMLRKIGINA